MATFYDARLQAFGALAAIYKLVRYRRPSLLEPDRELADFRTAASELREHTDAFLAAYKTVRPQLEDAIHDPHVVSICDLHAPYAHDIVGPLCNRILKYVENCQGDGGLALWRDLIRALTVPCADDLEFLNAHLDAESIRVKNARREKEKQAAPNVANRDDDGPWSPPDGPTQWARKFGFSTTTLKRRFDDGKIRHKKYSTKSYAIHVDDLPKTPASASSSRQ